MPLLELWKWEPQQVPTRLPTCSSIHSHNYLSFTCGETLQYILQLTVNTGKETNPNHFYGLQKHAHTYTAKVQTALKRER